MKHKRQVSRGGGLWLSGLIAMALPGCGAGSVAKALVVTKVPTPSIQIAPSRLFSVTGSYPEFSRPGTPTAAINKAIRQSIVNDQRQSGASSWPSLPGWVMADAVNNPGLYGLVYTGSLTSSSNVVVSTLMGVEWHAPGGTETDSYFIGLTFVVPSPQPVPITALFKNPTTGLELIGRYVQHAVLDPPAETSQECAAAVAICDGALAPSPSNYAQYALTSTGIALGFSQICGPACGPTEVTVPTRYVRTALSSLGRRLLNGVRSPSPS